MHFDPVKNARVADRADVERLKANWLADPCFDLTPPDPEFADYVVELRIFELEMLLEWSTKELEGVRAGVAKLRQAFLALNLVPIIE